jgi:hypothetical protein
MACDRANVGVENLVRAAPVGDDQERRRFGSQSGEHLGPCLKQAGSVLAAADGADEQGVIGRQYVEDGF